MAAERVKERLRRAINALDHAGVPYAVIGGNAVAEWVARIDEDAVRNTREEQYWDSVHCSRLFCVGISHRRQ